MTAEKPNQITGTACCCARRKRPHAAAVPQLTFRRPAVRARPSLASPLPRVMRSGVELKLTGHALPMRATLDVCPNPRHPSRAILPGVLPSLDPPQRSCVIQAAAITGRPLEEDAFVTSNQQRTSVGADATRDHPTFEARQLKSARGWYVRVSWQYGQAVIRKAKMTTHLAPTNRAR